MVLREHWRIPVRPKGKNTVLANAIWEKYKRYGVKGNILPTPSGENVLKRKKVNTVSR
jgi:hypothetical protein